MAEENEDNDAIELDDSIKKSGKGKLVLIIVLVLVLLSGITVGILFFTGAFSGGKSGKSNKAAANTEQVQEQEVAQGPAIYFELKPEFVVNFEDEQKASYLQVNIQLMTRNSQAISILEEHAPLIRNNILLQLSGQKYNELRTLEGKEKMRAEVLAAVQQIVETELGAPAVEAVFFTSFIMQ